MKNRVEKSSTVINWGDVLQALIYLEESYNALVTVSIEPCVPASEFELLCSVSCSCVIGDTPIKYVLPVLVPGNHSDVSILPREVLHTLYRLQETLETDARRIADLARRN